MATEKKFCIQCSTSKKEGFVEPTGENRCPVCGSDSLLPVDALTKFLSSKTQSPGLSIHEENTLISEFSSDELSGRRPASKPVRPNMVLHEVCFMVGKATLRCVRFAVSAAQAVEDASKDPSQPWYIHEGSLSQSGFLQAKAVNRNYSNPLKDS